MLKILIVDDRVDTREHLKELIELNLPDDAEIAVEDTFPLQDLKDYPSYVREHNISALVLDERLNEDKNPELGTHADYYGHDVVDFLRSRLPDFPVYVVTTHATDQDLMVKESQFEDIVDRDKFQQSADIYTARIQRAASRFQDAMRQHLLNLNSLTLKAVTGTLSEADHKLLTSTREMLGLPFTADTDLVLSDLVAHARELSILSTELLKKLKEKK